MLPPPPTPRQRKENMYGRDEHETFGKGIRELIETYPLYKKIAVDPPPYRKTFGVDAATLFCSLCKGDRTFRETKSHAFRIPFPGGGGVDETQYLESGVYVIQLECQDCKTANYYFMLNVFVDWQTGEKSTITKVGQYPIWIPALPKDVADELGYDAGLYSKALRNMNESYGIGACAYLRRLIEQYINPLLTTLLALRTEEGAEPDELARITDAINSKDFTRKTAFAAEIAPPSLFVQGTNPLKKLHDLLSESLHVHTEDDAMNIAMQLSKTVEFVIRQLRRRHEEQKAFAETMRELNKPRTAK